MAVTVKRIEDTNVLLVGLSGKLTKEDYSHFVPEVEKMIQEKGKVRILLKMHDFHGWEMGALWEDLKFDFRHFRDIERIAMVGETKWEKGMAAFCKPFTTAKVRYFDVNDAAQAREWVAAGSVPEISEEEASELVCAYTLHDANLAEIICNALRNEGIPCYVGDELQAGLTGIFEVDVMVRATDADRARAFIQSREQQHKTTI